MEGAKISGVRAVFTHIVQFFPGVPWDHRIAQLDSSRSPLSPLRSMDRNGSISQIIRHICQPEKTHTLLRNWADKGTDRPVIEARRLWPRRQ